MMTVKEKLKIRQGKEKDVPAILMLIKELAEYEKALDEVEITEEELLRDGFGQMPLYEFIVAELSGEVVGMALYYFKYSTWKGKALYLEDIIVKEKYRRKGIGEELFKAVIKRAGDENVRRMDWQVLEWNAPAIRFYKKFQANLDGEWINGKLTENQIKRIVQNEK
jgi:GNAT superfamily N-acetyltransferase